jgi:hypothetical protein
LLIYHDFANYKANLATARSVEADQDCGLVEQEGNYRGSVDITQMSWPWEPEFHEPEGCVDWGETEELVRSEVDTFSVFYSQDY